MADTRDRVLRFLAEGLPELAARQADRLVEEAPDNPESHHLRALVSLAQGDRETALVDLDRAVALDPQAPAARVERANLHLSLDDAPAALVDIRVAHGRAPSHPAVLVTLGRVHQALGRKEEALAVLLQARSAAPADPAVTHNLGRVLLELGRPEEALANLEAASVARREDPDILADLARCLRLLDRPGEAVAPLERAVVLRPDRPDLADALGGTLLAAERVGAAVARFRHSLELWPDRVDTRANLSAALIETGDLEAAVAEADLALERDPRDAGARVNRAFALCLTGDYARGLEDYRHRWRTEEFQGKYAPLEAPEWDGFPLPGGTLLARGEQGLGDQIMAARYLTWARERVGRLIFECHPGLHDLLAHSLPGVDLVTPGIPSASPDAWVGAMDLARLAGTTATHMPVPVPYLVAPGEGRGARVPGPPRVGLVWAGKRRPRDRSCPLAPLVRLCGEAGLEVHALQMGPRRADLEALSEERGVIDRAGEITTMADTARLLTEMDLVLSVDTSVAHLAGALGLPGYVLLLATPDWRWGQTGDRGVWYPSLRLVRQNRPGDWDSAIARLSRLLAEPGFGLDSIS